jgi:hypothetical protein
VTQTTKPPTNPGRVWMPPVLQGNSSDNLCDMALLSVVCQASDRGLRHGAGMLFEELGPHRFKELFARAPGLVSPF